jgi:hypothetical protein
MNTKALLEEVRKWLDERTEPLSVYLPDHKEVWVVGPGMEIVANCNHLVPAQFLAYAPQVLAYIEELEHRADKWRE